MKLYKVPNNTWVMSREPNCDDVFFFEHIDGMYSYCKDKDGSTCHYAAFMEVEIITSNSDGSLSDGMS